MMDGPRSLHSSEWEQLNTVVETVFRPQMFEQYPQLFNEANRDNLRVVAADGKVVSHVGMIERPASLLGCSIRVCCIGGVATLSDYRERGYASAAFADAVAKARADGVDLMLISGGRGLYLRAGSRRVGQDQKFTVTPAAAPRLQATTTGIRVAAVTGEHIPLLRNLYAAEATRFVRWREDWEMAYGCKYVMNRPTEFHLIYRGADPVAYLLLQTPRPGTSDDEPRVVAEFAGDRSALVCALGQLASARNIALRVHVLRADTVLASLLGGAAVPAEPAPTSGTLLVINFVQFMERLRPLLAERLGAQTARQLTFHAADDRFTIAQCAESITVSGRGDLALYLFGSHDWQAKTAQSDGIQGGAVLTSHKGESIEPIGSPALAAQLRQALPFPALWYGISYV